MICRLLIFLFFSFPFFNAFSKQQEIPLKYEFNIEAGKKEARFNVNIHLQDNNLPDSIVFSLDSCFKVEQIKSGEKTITFLRDTSGDMYKYVVLKNSSIRNEVLHIKYHCNLIDNFIELTSGLFWYPFFEEGRNQQIFITINKGDFNVISSHPVTNDQRNKGRIYINDLKGFDDFGIVLLKDFNEKKIKYNENTYLSIYHLPSFIKYADRLKLNIESMIGIFMENFGLNNSSKRIDIIVLPRDGDFSVSKGILAVLPELSFLQDYENWNDRAAFLREIAYYYSGYWLTKCLPNELQGFKSYFSLLHMTRFLGFEFPASYYSSLKNELLRLENSSGKNLSLKIPLILNTISHLIGYNNFKFVLKKIFSLNDTISVEKIVEYTKKHFGIDYKWYIVQWYETNILPDLSVTYTISNENQQYKLNFNVEQKTGKIFKLPLEIEISFENEKISKVLLVDKKKINFDLYFEKKPLKLIVDPSGMFFGRIQPAKY